MSEQDNVPTEGDLFTPEEQTQFDSMKAEPAPEAVPEESASEETAQEEAPQEAKTEEKQVNLGALHEERQRRKEADERARQAEIKAAKYEARVQAWLDAQQQSKQEPQVELDPDKDIFTFAKHVGKEVGDIRAELQQQRQAVQAAREKQQYFDWANKHEPAFIKENPDYIDAVKHLREQRFEELVEMGYEPNQANEIVQNDEYGLVRQAHQMGKNPAEYAYNLAKRRGYQKRAAGTQSLSERMGTIAAGQKNNQTLSSVGGRAGGGELSARDLLSMDKDEFESFMNKSPKQFRRIMGSPN